MKNKRFAAFLIDIVIGSVFALLIYGILHYLHIKVIAAMIVIIVWAVLIGKDCINGMSIGKLLIGIQVIDINTKQIASPQKCVIRNLFYFIGLFDVIVMLTNSKGTRIGDYVTHTEVTLRNKSLAKVKLSKELLAIGYVLIGLAIIEAFYYFVAPSLFFYKLPLY